MTDIPRQDCWLYAGSINAQGYGTITIGKTVHRVHRATYENKFGRIPKGLIIDHLCRVRSCVNPDHLEVVTQAENKRRGMSPAAQNARKTHCNKGHEYSEENTYISARGYRECRTCRKVWDAAKKEKSALAT